jgi:hypothetical protein
MTIGTTLPHASDHLCAGPSWLACPIVGLESEDGKQRAHGGKGRLAALATDHLHSRKPTRAAREDIREHSRTMQRSAGNEPLHTTADGNLLVA